jgi:hypothetical protein
MTELSIGRSLIASTPRTPSASADASYLRQLLERQPGCLIRVRRDGVFLACNDAALGLFDVDTLGAILNTNLTDRLVAADRGDWQEFANRVWTSGAASVEYHLTIPDAADRTVLFQGIAINDHPDGVDSLLLSLRDTSVAHRLETSLQSEEISREGDEERQKDTRERLEQALAEHQQLAAQIEEFRAERQRLTAALDAHIVEREHREAEYREKSAALEGGEKGTRAQLERALTDRQQLATQIEELRAERQRLTAALDAQIADHQHKEAEYRAKSVELEQRAEEGQLAFLTREHQARERIAGLEAELTASVAEQGRLATAYKQQLDAAHQALGSHEQHRQDLADLELRLQAATVEQARLLALVAEHEGQREHLDAEHRAAVESLEQSLRRACEDSALNIEQAHQPVSELTSQLSHALGEQSRLSGLIGEREREQDHLDAERRRALADLEVSHGEALAGRERTLTGEHEHVRQQNEKQRFELADLKKRHAEALAEQQRLSDLVSERESQQETRNADHARTIADIEARHHQALARATQAWHEERELIRQQIKQQSRQQITQQIAQQSDAQQLEIGYLSEAHDKSVAEQRRLSELLKQAEADRQQIDAARAADRAEMERRFASALNQTLAEQESASRERIASLQSELGQAVSDQMRLQTLVAQGQSRQKRVVAEYAADCAQSERALGEAILTKNRVLKALADQRVELQRWQDAATELEPLAAAGRLAADVAGELQEVLRQIDEQAKFVLTLCSSEAASRAEIETLRADALRAASLARQFALSKARQLEVPSPAEPAYVRPSADTPDDPLEDL